MINKILGGDSNWSYILSTQLQGGQNISNLQFESKHFSVHL